MSIGSHNAVAPGGVTGPEVHLAGDSLHGSPGFQSLENPLALPVSLHDSFGRTHTYLRISVTDRCNLRCRYCMPVEEMTWQPSADILTNEEILRIARICTERLGIRKIRITGGEPMVRNGIETLIEKLAKLPSVDFLAMTTNGMFLADKAAILKNAGLQGLNISLDTLRPERFLAITQRRGLEKVLTGIDAALAQNFDVLKLNVVLMGGVNDDEILDFVAFTRNLAMNLRFIEFMPFKQNGWTPETMVPYQNIRARIEEHYRLVPLETEASAVAKDFQLDGYPGTVSFITSMTENFCGTCNRVRLTADGAIKSCLFHPAENSLRDILRSSLSLPEQDIAVERGIRESIFKKPIGHAPMAEIDAEKNRPMIQIGG